MATIRPSTWNPICKNPQEIKAMACKNPQNATLSNGQKNSFIHCNFKCPTPNIMQTPLCTIAKPVLKWKTILKKYFFYWTRKNKKKKRKKLETVFPSFSKRFQPKSLQDYRLDFALGSFQKFWFVEYNPKIDGLSNIIQK